MQSPMRQVSCYGRPRPVYPAWHDYFTDHGGEEGRPDVEEEIDTAVEIVDEVLIELAARN